MTLYAEKPPTIQAHRVTSPDHAAELIGATAEPTAEGGYLFRKVINGDPFVIGPVKVGDYLADYGTVDGWTHVPAAVFEARYERATPAP